MKNRSKPPKAIQDEDIDELEKQLRLNYQKYQEQMLRGQVELKSQTQIGHGASKTIKHFYLPPKISLLEDPEKQMAFRKKFINDVSNPPEPEPLVLLGDVLHLQLLSTIGDRSCPSIVKQDLATFFKRRLAQLQVKKLKMITRWAFHSRISIPDLEKTGAILDKALGRLQQEIDLTINRVDRLSGEDNYNSSSAARPIPSTKDEAHPNKSKPLYEQNEDIPSASAIRQDDIEVYLRIQTFRNKIFRTLDKFVTDIAWLPYLARFEIWEQSRISMQDYKHEAHAQHESLKKTIGLSIKQKLSLNGIFEERIVTAIIDKFTTSIKGPDGGISSNVPRMQYLLNSHKTQHERPPILVSSNIEQNIQLTALAKEFGITGDIELDNGHMFTYSVQVIFPGHFQQQSMQMTFDSYDTSKDSDYATIERLIKNIEGESSQQAEKTLLIQEMKRTTAMESKKSMVGRINAQSWKDQDVRGIKNLEAAAKDNNVNQAFFTLQESQFKLKRADWLHHVCFEGTVSEAIKRQSNYLNQVDQYDSLLESAFNFLDVNDASSVNRILEDSSQSHVKRAQLRNQTKHENQTSSDDQLESYLRISLQKAGQAKLDEIQRQQVKELKESIQGAEKPLNLSDPIPTHVIKAYYTLRFLKSRDKKIKLLHTLNYFRSVQKRLALDLKEHLTRNKSAIVHENVETIYPQFEKGGQFDQIKFQENSSTSIFSTTAKRQLDDKQNDEHPVTMKALKYNKKFNPSTSSTCPCVPRYHVTFMRPRLYEQLSEQIQTPNLSQHIKRYEGQQDRWDIDENTRDVIVYDEFGIKIIYQESLNDMLELEEELIKLGTYFIEQAECQVDSDVREPSSAIDRGEVAMNLIDVEAEYQFHKVLLIELYLEAYEHTLDPIELIRIVQVIADLMVQRPRLNVEGSYFIDTYRSEIEVLKQRRELFREVIDYQFDLEREEVHMVAVANELKYRKLQDEGFKYKDNITREKQLSVSEEEKHKKIAAVLSKKGVGKDVTFEKLMEESAAHEADRKKKISDIAARHVTGYVDQPYQNFEEILGMNQSEGNKHLPDSFDPHTIDGLRESAFYSKQVDGYPSPFEKDPFNQYTLFGAQSHRIGVLDFFDSLSTLSKIEAALQQAFLELVKVHMPENGFAISTLETQMLIEARGRFKLMKSNEPLLTKSLSLIEEDFYLGRPDKLMFLMKEFRAHLSPSLIKHMSNPLLVAKLDVKAVSKFDFPRIKQKDVVKESDQLTPDQVLTKMIDVAKISIAGDGKIKEPKHGLRKKKQVQEATDMFAFESEGEEGPDINPPSLMIMSCNILEVLRLREEIIHRVHETDLISAVYTRQLGLVNKSNTKLMLQDSINFDASKIMTDNMNLVDLNDGSKLNFDLTFREFDGTLRANLDFKSESCIKALFTNLGVEELRAVLHYQIMQQQLLHVAVVMNQLLIDGSVKAISEVDMLSRKKPFTVPNAILNLPLIISKTTEGCMGDMLAREKTKYKSILSRDVGEAVYLIDSKKSKLRFIYSKKFETALGRLNGALTTEVKLRLLRSFRIKLLHCFCREVLKETYQDSLKIQILQTNNSLRLSSMLFPKDSNVFKYGIGNIQDSFSNGFIQDNIKFTKDYIRLQEASLSTLMNAESLFYIPSTDEIIQFEPVSRSGAVTSEVQIPGGDIINEELIDRQIKDLVQIPKVNHHYKQDIGFVRPFRKVAFSECYNQNSESFKLLNYLTLFARNFKLKYLMMRNSATCLEVLQLEDSVLNGIPFWDTNKDSLSDNHPDKQISQHIIQRIIKRKKNRLNLADEMNAHGARLLTMNHWMNKANILASDYQNGRVERLIELLNIHNAIIFKRFYLGLDYISETYLDQGNDECFQKTMIIRNELTRKVPSLNRYYENGFNMNQICFQSQSMDFKQQSLSDNAEFLRTYQPFIDESNLIPIEMNLVQSMFSQFTTFEVLCLQALTNTFVRDYSYLENSFLNFKDEQRLYAYTNFMSLDEKLKKYLIHKGLQLGDNSIKEILQAELEYLSIEAEAKQMQTVMMCWIAKGDLPINTTDYKKLLKKYKDQTVFKIVEERDAIIAVEKIKQAISKDAQAKTKADGEEDNSIPQKKTVQLPFGAKVSSESMRDSVMIEGGKLIEKHFNTNLCEMKAEVKVIKKQLEIRLMKFTISMLDSEHSSLLAAFEQVGTEKELSLYIHPEQQFAATIQGYPPLDVVTKLTSVQQFITRLRNRCTEVDTLTSGTAIVFTLKDFNECLQTMCRSLLKYGEQELKARGETSSIKENHYQHMLYLKEQQTSYYRRKCEHILREVDKIVSAKLTQRGSQIIYELDLSNRELRIVKDNIFLMEKMMRQDLRHEYERAIVERENEKNKYKESFLTYKSDFNNQIKEEVAMRISETAQDIKKIVFNAKSTKDEQYFGTQSSIVEPRLGQTAQSPRGSGLLDLNLNSVVKQGYYEQEQMKEINAMNRFIRMFKVFTQMKEVISNDKHERELFNQKQKLTSNECLWEQLAEAEKRENITRQELYLAQQNIATYEKIIGKLQHQLESLQSDKVRLLQFKSTKSKQIEAMETKIRDVEILENIDLQKVMDELKARDKKVKELSDQNRGFNEKMELTQMANDKRIIDMKKQLEREREMKSQAMNQLDSMRMEIKVIEGNEASIDSDLWKLKCKQLFEMCKDLQNENDQLKDIVKQQPLHDQTDQQTLLDASHYYQMGPIENNNAQRVTDRRDYNTVLSYNDPITKPQTAAGGKHSKNNQLSGQVQNRHDHQNNTSHQYGGYHLPDGTLTSGLSLPEIMLGQEFSEGNKSPTIQSLKQKNGFKDVYQINKSREQIRPYQHNPQMINSSDLLTANAFTSVGSEQTNFKQNKRGKNGIIKGLISAKTRERLVDISDDGALNIMKRGGEIKSSDNHGARNNSGIVFNSGQMSNQSHTRGGQVGMTLLGNQNKFQGKRLMTSQGPRKLVNEPSTTGTLHSSIIPNMKELGHQSMRKSGEVLVSTSTVRGGLNQRNPQFANNSANLASGLSIANASLPFNPSQFLGGVKGQPVNLNFNFNTTNINMNK